MLDYQKYTEISEGAPPGDFTSAQSNIQSRISNTLSWMQSNQHTEMRLVGLSVRISSVGCESADIGGSSIPFQSTVTYLGSAVHLDQTLSMKQHISSLCRTTFLALRRIASIHPFPSNSSTEKLVASISRQDWTTAMLLLQVLPMNKSRAYKTSRTTPSGLSWEKKIEAWSWHTAF